MPQRVRKILSITKTTNTNCSVIVKRIYYHPVKIGKLHARKVPPDPMLFPRPPWTDGESTIWGKGMVSVVYIQTKSISKEEPVIVPDYNRIRKRTAALRNPITIRGLK